MSGRYTYARYRQHSQAVFRGRNWRRRSDLTDHPADDELSGLAHEQRGADLVRHAATSIADELCRPWLSSRRSLSSHSTKGQPCVARGSALASAASGWSAVVVVVGSNVTTSSTPSERRRCRYRSRPPPNRGRARDSDGDPSPMESQYQVVEGPRGREQRSGCLLEGPQRSGGDVSQLRAAAVAFIVRVDASGR